MPNRPTLRPFPYRRPCARGRLTAATNAKSPSRRRHGTRHDAIRHATWMDVPERHGFRSLPLPSKQSKQSKQASGYRRCCQSCRPSISAALQRDYYSGPCVHMTIGPTTETDISVRIRARIVDRVGDFRPPAVCPSSLSRQPVARPLAEQRAVSANARPFGPQPREYSECCAPRKSIAVCCTTDSTVVGDCFALRNAPRWDRNAVRPPCT